MNILCRSFLGGVPRESDGGGPVVVFFLSSHLPAGDADVRSTLVSRAPWWYVRGHKGVALLGNSSSADMSLRSYL